MNKKLIIILVAVLLLVVGLSGCFEEKLCDGIIVTIEKLDSEPAQYTNVSKNEMDQFPAVKRAIEKNLSYASEPINSGESENVKVFFNVSINNIRENFFKYENVYYIIQIHYAEC